MKNLKIILLAFLLILPINTNAYSKYIIPGGESVGIDIKTDGILVVGFYKINGKFNKGTPEIKIGDKITHVNNISIDSVDSLVNTIESNMKDNKVTLTYNRDGKIYNSVLNLYYEDNTYKTGLYVKDDISGIGTLSYIDPESHIYGALGHEIVETNTNSIVDVKTGTIFKSYVTSIDRSVRGTPGGKNAKFYSDSVFGNITKNTIKGIYGNYNNLPDKNTMEVGTLDDVKPGLAYIYTVIDGENIDKFEINITRIDKDNNVKNIYFNVTDKRLLEKTGGIIQGMSGSPIIQDNKIIGAVTHVVVSDPQTGYGISIIKMLEEGEK